MKLTEIQLFFNTPLTDFNNTIHFKSNGERDSFFPSVYRTKSFMSRFNYSRDKGVIKLSMTFEEIQGYNYLRFRSQLDTNQWYYAFISGISYVNEQTVEIGILVDPLITFTQGDKLMNLRNVQVEREHLTQSDYNEYLPRLRNNDDILATYTKKYKHQKQHLFATLDDSGNEWAIVFMCSADLERTPGTEDAPELHTSTGVTYDSNTSPVNLYIARASVFSNIIMKELQDRPWISQLISSAKKIPIAFLDPGDFDTINEETFLNGTPEKPYPVALSFWKPKDGGTSNKEIPINLTYTTDEMLSIMGITREDLHLLRVGYTTLEGYSMDGQQVLLDVNLLPTSGLSFSSVTCLGYSNQIIIYPENYNTTDFEPDLGGNDKGTYVNNAFCFNNFDDIPVLIDNGALAKANTAYTRNLAESRLGINRVKNMFDSSANTRDRFMSALSIIPGAVGNVAGAGGGIANGNIGVAGNLLTPQIQMATEEYEFYRTQDAQFKEMSLSTPTITAMSTGNAFAIANDKYGITMKFSCPDYKEIQKLQRYHRLRGFQISEIKPQLSNINSMSLMNFVQFTCPTFTQIFDDVVRFDTRLVPIMKLIFENGVKLWHNNGMANPFSQDILNNKRVL